MIDRPNWHHSASCRDHDPAIFFSENPADLTRARAVCAGCPVRVECRQEGEEMNWGVWGGTVRHRVKGAA